MKLPKLGLRGAVKTRNGKRVGSPLKHDAVLIDLMNQLSGISMQDSFNRWRAEVLERLEEDLDDKGLEVAEDAYGVFRVKMENLVRSVTKIAHYVNNGNLSLTRVSSKAHISLNEAMIACETIASRLKYLAPPGAMEEDALGFTRYCTATILIRDEFEQFEKLKICKDILQILRDKVVDMVAGRHMLMEMDKFAVAVESFTGLMMEDVGLLPVLRKQRQLKPPLPPKSLMVEMRGDVVKQALIARSKNGKHASSQTSERSFQTTANQSDTSLSTDVSSIHQPKSSRRSVSDASRTSASSLDVSNSKTGRRRSSSASKRRERSARESNLLSSPQRSASMTKAQSRSQDASDAQRMAVSTTVAKSRSRDGNELPSSSRRIASMTKEQSRSRVDCESNMENGRKIVSVRYLNTTEDSKPKSFSRRSENASKRELMDTNERPSESSRSSPEKVPSFSRRKPRSDARGLTDTDHRKGSPQRFPSLSRRNPKSERIVTGNNETQKRGPEKIPSFSRRRPMSDKKESEWGHTDNARKSFSPKEAKLSESSSIKEISRLRSDDIGSIGSSFIQEGLVKFEPKKSRKARQKNDGEDDNRTAVSISSKKKLKMKAKLAKKGKHMGKSSARERMPPKMRKQRKESQMDNVHLDDLVEIDEGYGSGGRNPFEKTQKGHSSKSESAPLEKETRRNDTIESDPKSDTAIERSREYSQDRKAKSQTSKHASKSSEDVPLRRSPHNVVAPSKKESGKGLSQTSLAKETAEVVELLQSAPESQSAAESRKHRYNSSVIDKHEKLRSQPHSPVKTDSGRKYSKPRLNKIPSKMKTQWPPKSKSPVTTQGKPTAPGTGSKQPSSPSQKGLKKDLADKSHKIAGAEGKSRQKSQKKSLPSLLDDCSSVDPEEEDSEILDILNGSSLSHSSSFEKRREMFEKMANYSSVSLDFRLEKVDDEEDIDPLELFEKSRSKALDVSTHSVGLVSEKRSIYEKLSSSKTSFGAAGNDEDMCPLDVDPLVVEGRGRDSGSTLDQLSRSHGSVHERRAMFEHLDYSLSTPIKKNNGGRDMGTLTRNEVAELGASTSEISVMFLDGHGSDELSSGLKSFKKDVPWILSPNPWVQKENRSGAKVSAPNVLDIGEQKLQIGTNGDCIASRAQSQISNGSDEKFNVREWANRFEDTDGDASIRQHHDPQVTYQTSNQNEDSVKVSGGNDLASMPGKDENTTTNGQKVLGSAPQKKIWERPDSPLKKKKPWERKPETSDLVKMWDKRETQPWDADAVNGQKKSNRTGNLDMHDSYHGNMDLEVSRHGKTTRRRKEDVKKEALSINISPPLPDETVTATSLSPEEKGLLVAGVVEKKRIEEQARKRALEKVEEENRRKAEEDAKRQEEEDALRMAEEVFRLELEENGNGETAIVFETSQTKDSTAPMKAQNTEKSVESKVAEQSARQRQGVKSGGLPHFSGYDHLSSSQPWRSKAFKSPLDGSEHQTYDKPFSSAENLLFSGSDHLSKAQPWRTKAFKSPLDGSESQVFEKLVSSTVAKISANGGNTSFTKRRVAPDRNRSVLSQISTGSVIIFEDHELEKSIHEPTPKMNFKPVSQWASTADDLKKQRDGKSRLAVAAKKPTKPKMERSKPHVADDSSVVKRKKSSRQKGQVTYFKTARPVARAREKSGIASTASGWAAPLKMQ